MEMIERLVITYLANAVWMTCLIALAAIQVAKVLRHSPSAHLHVLWVMALIFASSLPLTSLHNALRVDGGVLTDSVGNANTNSFLGGAGGWSPKFFLLTKLPRQRAVPFVPRLTHLLAVVYFIFFIYRGLSLCWAWHRMQMLARGARCRTLSLYQAAVEHCCSGSRLERVSIESSNDFPSPVVVGIWRPQLILPEWFFSCASEEELLSTLCHELAHVRRHDFLLNLAYEILFLPISFHPAAMVIKSQIEQSRELACDEIAAGNLPTHAAYARALMSIAQIVASTSSASSSGRSRYALGLFVTDALEARIMNLLNKRNRMSKTRGRAQAAAASGLLAAACLMASAFSIQVAAGNTTAELKQFAGTWEGKLRGKTFVSLKLAAKDGKIAGTVSRVRIEMGANGALTDASPVTGEDAISEAALEGKVLHLNTKAKGHVSTIAGASEESIQYDMRLSGTNQAELQIAGVSAGMPVPVPWKLERKSATR
jgi:beta-lactamase regulating signal transducer with metallopeptidase domain